MEILTYISSYSPSCGYCKSIEKQWEELGRIVLEEELDLKVGRFDVINARLDFKEKIREVLPKMLPGVHMYIYFF